MKSDPAFVSSGTHDVELCAMLESSVALGRTLCLPVLDDAFVLAYSSLTQFRPCPLTDMTTVRAFVRGATHDVALCAIVESSVALGRNLGLTVVAEGAEEREDGDLIAALGCHQAQGYFVS